MTGYLLIPSLRIGVPAYEGPNRQEIIDRPDSAVLIRWGDMLVIADHNGQAGFSRLNQAKVGKTKAFVWSGGKCVIYQCDRSEIGSIQLSEGGNRLFMADQTPAHIGMTRGLCIYTCYGKAVENIQPVRLTHWARLN